LNSDLLYLRGVVENKDEDIEGTDHEEDEHGSSQLCEVCRESHNANNNKLNQCQICNIFVHSECYGFPLTSSSSISSSSSSSSRWECDSCIHSRLNPVCALCPVKEGPLKRTTDWRWAHLTCALWIPEVFFRHAIGREPIDILQCKRFRWNQKCVHCNLSYGACIQCSHSGCDKIFHVSCGMQNGIYLEYKSSNKRGGADIVISFCNKHAIRWMSGKCVKSIVRPRA